MDTRGWPFLISRGRRVGYRTLLAPAPLVTDGDYAVLTDHVEPGVVLDQPGVIDLTTSAGRPISVVHATHRVSGADLGQADAPKDEHGRPLHLLYGFVCPRARAIRPDEADLRTALTAALTAYQSFLEDEKGFTVQAGEPFHLRSSLEAPASGRGTVLRIALAAALLVVLLLALRWVSASNEREPADPGPIVVTPAETCASPPVRPTTPPNIRQPAAHS